MKKLIALALLLLPIKLFAGTTDYYNLQHFEIDNSTTTGNINNIMRLRGDFFVYKDSQTILLQDCTAYFEVSSDTVKISTKTFIVPNGSNIRFEVLDSSTNIKNNFNVLNGSMTIKVDGTNAVFTVYSSSVGVNQNLYVGANTLISQAGNIAMTGSAKSIRQGPASEFSLGYSPTDTEWRIAVFDDIAQDNRVAFSITKSTECFFQYGLGVPIATEAYLKAHIPARKGMQAWDSTNDQLVVSTGTAAGSYGLLTSTTTLPTGW